MLSADDFERIVISAAQRQQMRLQIFDRTGAGPDHPSISNYPESRYLKVIWARVLY
jgi:23S rRNA (cytosine1962-C5)-methyltransferase